MPDPAGPRASTLTSRSAPDVVAQMHEPVSQVLTGGQVKADAALTPHNQVDGCAGERLRKRLAGHEPLGGVGLHAGLDNRDAHRPTASSGFRPEPPPGEDTRRDGGDGDECNQSSAGSAYEQHDRHVDRNDGGTREPHSAQRRHRQHRGHLPLAGTQQAPGAAERLPRPRHFDEHPRRGDQDDRGHWLSPEESPRQPSPRRPQQAEKCRDEDEEDVHVRQQPVVHGGDVASSTQPPAQRGLPAGRGVGDDEYQGHQDDEREPPQTRLGKCEHRQPTGSQRSEPRHDAGPGQPPSRHCRHAAPSQSSPPYVPARARRVNRTRRSCPLTIRMNAVKPLSSAGSIP